MNDIIIRRPHNRHGDCDFLTRMENTPKGCASPRANPGGSMSITKIETTRLIQMTWDTAVLVNEHDRMHSYQMTIPARPQDDDTTLGWVLNYGKPDRRQLHAAISVMESYCYLLSAEITTGEAINRLRCLRREYQSQPGPKPVQ